MSIDLTLPQRAADFWAKVRMGDPSDCWPWLARNRGPKGYGRFYVGDRYRSVQANRVAFCLANGVELRALLGLEACHACDNPPCCNPDHLWIGTRQDNIADRVAKGRKSGPPPSNTCRRGHEAYRIVGGKRRCVECIRARERVRCARTKDQRRAYDQARYAADPQAQRLRVLKYYDAHAEERRAYARARRASKKGSCP